MSDLTQTRIGRYELRERVGAGGTARVYKALDTTLERLVAIKVLYEHLAEDGTFKERFEREAKLIAGFNHPNIVQVFDFNVQMRGDQPLYYMVMTYIPGKTLRQEMSEIASRGRRMPHERILQIMLNMTDALGYAHTRGMVHRDVKPGNIIVRDDGQAILTDFGIARMVQGERLTQNGVTTGTPVYMSPEQANGDPGDARSDLYSLAIILFEMLAGAPPFNDDNNLSVMLKHLNAPVPKLSSVTKTPMPKFDAFLARALSKNPVDRFPNAEAFASALKVIFAEDDDELTHLLPSSSVPVATPLKGDTTPQVNVLTSLVLPVFKRSPVIGAAAIIAIIAVLIWIAVIALVRNEPPEFTVSPTMTPQTVASMTGNDGDTVNSSGSLYINAQFSPDDQYNDVWTLQDTDMSATSITPEGFLRLENRTPNTAMTSIVGTSFKYRDVSLTMDAELEPDSEPASAYGIVFRYQDEDNYNVFAVDGIGRYSIWTRLEGVWNELRDAETPWTPNESVKPIGDPNTLSVVILHDEFTAYVNNRRVLRVSDTTFDDGQIGIYIAADAGTATVLVDKYRAFSSVPSMTDPTG